MLDFMTVATRNTARGVLEIFPKFIMKKSDDLMIRGSDFYAIWDEERGLWSTDEQDVVRLVDKEVKKFAEEKYQGFDSNIRILYMWDADSGVIDRWHKYCQKQMRDNYRMLDEKLIFANTEVNKKDYASKRLSYPLEPGNIPAWTKLISTLYSEEERTKIEWAIGAIVSGDSKEIQKFMVLYGEAGAGKSTILNIIQQLFEGYYSVFDAKALGSSSNQFALEAFRKNPLVAIQHDGDLSKIEDNTRLNSVVSHELMTVSEKFKSSYESQFKCFLFMGTNKPVKITDAKSGLIRRLIDVTPSGNKLPRKEYNQTIKQIGFELGGIAKHCLDLYLDNPGRYDDYVPIEMMGASNDFYNFILDSYHIFKREDGTTLKAAWEMYKTYCDEARVPYPFSQKNFKEELKNYFYDFNDRFSTEDGSRVRSYYSGFRLDRFDVHSKRKKEESDIKLIEFTDQESIFDNECSDYFAQYAASNGKPLKEWDKVSVKLSELDTSKLHYVRVPENHIVIDFDIPDENGNKCFEKNLKAASEWPATYAELSKSGAGIHLHYIYTGDPEQLSRVYADHIEVKVFTGKSSLRRKLSKCNNLPIANISSGLPMKGEKKMVNFEGVKNEKAIRTSIKRNLNKEIHDSTKCSMDFICKILDDAYNSGVSYDVSDMKNAIIAFAASSTNQSDYCMKLVHKMKFKSEEPSDYVDSNNDMVFYDVEVFPNLFLVNWKIAGEGKSVVRMINPKPSDIETLMRFKLVGFNNRDYDNHILYARLMGYTNEQLYNLSSKLVNDDKKISRSAKFGEAYNLSYTDVYDFSTDKKGLKKWEIELGIHHQELGLPWDQPVPEERWVEVAEYCDNDVIATEAVFNHLKGDWAARKIQVEIAKSMHPGINACVNDSTNSLSAKIIFGSNRKPQREFNWRDLSQPVGSDQYEEYRRKFGDDYKFRVFDDDGLPLYRDYIPGEQLPEGYSILPFFKAYKYEFGRSTFMGEEVGEGGRVYAEPGMYCDVWDGDIASQHPHSIIFEMLFGRKYTKIFEEIVRARVAVKHRDFDTAGTLLGGALKPYLSEEFADALAQALKIVINSIYGLTKAAFENAFRDPRNVDNIVAKRGNLFMTLLKREVQKRGYTVAHIKTDSIKIPNADQEIIDFVTKFGKEYGYTFETEANFDRFCLVNDAVYIARHKDGQNAGKWAPTGKQFQIPYVFKTLFSKEPLQFEDYCVSIAVKKGHLCLDMNENLPGDEHNYRFVGRVGLFCPIKFGANGGILWRVHENKYSAPPGTLKDSKKKINYRWLESEVVKKLGKEKDIDRSYYDKLVDDAVSAISQYGDFEWFVSDDSRPEAELINELNKAEAIPDPEYLPTADTPLGYMDCGVKITDACDNCPDYDKDEHTCKRGFDPLPF